MIKNDMKAPKDDGAKLFAQAHELVDSGNASEGFFTMNKALEMGCKDAYLSLGYFFDHGIGVQKDQKKALDLYKKSYAVGGSKYLAACNIGISYRDIYNNSERAEFWLKRAIELGLPEAMVDLAKLYINSSNKRRVRESIDLLRSAIRADHPPILDDTREEAEKLLALVEQRGRRHDR